MIFETHAHYEDQAFDEDRATLLPLLKERGINPIINVGSQLSTTEESVELAKQYDFVFAAVGIHPSEIQTGERIKELGLEGTLARLRELSQFEKTVAIGEIGLDYYWDKEPQVQELQRGWFRAQLKLAKEVDLPVIIHSRDAAEDTLSIMREAYAEGVKGVIHCYSYSPEIAKEYVKMGYYIGVGGVVTFKNAKKLVATVEQIPMESILLETDCPYMAPEPHRGTRNDSKNIPYVIEKIAQIKGISPESVEEIARRNAFTLFVKTERFYPN